MTTEAGDRPMKAVVNKVLVKANFNKKLSRFYRIL